MLAFSHEWALAWGAALNESAGYRVAAAGWEGSIAAVARAAGDEGHPRHAVFLDVWHGECRAARSATPEDLAAATYLLEGEPRAWRELLEGRLAPMMAILTGRVVLARGEMAKLLPYAGAARELVALAASLEAEFPADW